MTRQETRMGEVASREQPIDPFIAEALGTTADALVCQAARVGAGDAARVSDCGRLRGGRQPAGVPRSGASADRGVGLHTCYERRPPLSNHV